jgi:hypothetical protein
MYANTANGFTEWHLRKCNWKNDNVGFQLNRPFLFVTACRGKIIHISRRIHIIRSRVATHLSFPHFLQTKWRLVFLPGWDVSLGGRAKFQLQSVLKILLLPTGNFPVGLVLLWGLKKGDFLAPKKGSKNRSKRRPPKSQTKRKITTPYPFLGW